MDTDEDLALALQLQNEFDEESPAVALIKPADHDHSKLSPVDPSWEYLDPIPDIRALFLQFNDQFFWGRLAGIEVRWSPRMTLCAGLCCYEGRGGLCSVRLSVPLLKLRPRKDLVETLLHEMIHAYLFVTDNNKDHDGHGPEFHKHMYRINKDTGSNISVYHTFHDEVDNYRQHWWRCTGPCRQRKPYFGYVKRAMNRAPSERDPWWRDHKNSCNGVFEKVKEPEGYGKKKKASGKSEGMDIKKREKGKEINKNMDIRLFGGKGNVLSTDKGKDSSQNVSNKKVTATNSNKIQKTLTGRMNGNRNVSVMKGENKSPVTSTVTSGEITPKTLVNGVLSKKLHVNDVTTGSDSLDLSGSRSLNHVSTQPGYHGNHIIKETSHVSLLDSDEEDLSQVCKLTSTNLIALDRASSKLTSDQEDVKSKLREVWTKRFNTSATVSGLPALCRPKKRTQDSEPKLFNPSAAKRCRSDEDNETRIDGIFNTSQSDQNLPLLSRLESKSLNSSSQKCINSTTNVPASDSQNTSVLGNKKSTGKKTSIPGKKKTCVSGIDSSQNTVSGMFSKMRSPEKDKKDIINDGVLSLPSASPTFHECPVCTKLVLEAEMNDHLDLCLSS
ncbi:DNA-dependent metalloprotease SPRTN-like [Ylistrum balloti]|uniref:DNA-dependent metalloprotease SPRTN-like n=1 Tax=Ylistrum balloti TaxID=509963 RepID=UPI002905ADE3|nr:DNA-dependent metalloprotease SPRTN-like [Ylistrum balloti]